MDEKVYKKIWVRSIIVYSVMKNNMDFKDSELVN